MYMTAIDETRLCSNYHQYEFSEQTILFDRIIKTSIRDFLMQTYWHTK